MIDGKGNSIFSQSKIWHFQRKYFIESGIDSWSSGAVPHYVTSNPVVGKTYAEMALALLRDLAFKGKTVDTLFLLELGAGHGRLCYHFFKHFEKYYEESAIVLPPFVYILSDFTEANLDFWKEQSRLRPYIAKGWLDFALFDAEKSSEIVLQTTGKVIRKEDLNQPLIVVANYFFDSIPQDLFYINDHTISDCEIIVSNELDANEYSTSEIIANLEIEYAYKAIEKNKYQDAVQEKILSNYIQKLKNTHLMFPNVGIDCINRLKKLSSAGLILMTADKGIHYLSGLENRSPPKLSKHGSFSLNVNYHALKEHCNLSGGHALFPRHQQAYIDIGCLIYVEDHASFKETRNAYERFVNDFGPDDYFSLKKLIEKHYDTFTVRDIFSVIRLSAYDAHIFKQMTPRIMELIPEFTDNEKWNLYQAIPRIWDTYYPIGEETDLALSLGLILYYLDFYDAAIVFFEKSLILYGQQAHVLFNVALCYYYTERFLESKSIVIKLLEDDSENEVYNELWIILSKRRNE
jgi:hypothetical protein